MEGRDRHVVHRWSRERWLTLSRANVPYAILSRGHEWYSYCVPGCRPKCNSIVIYRRRALLFVENWFSLHTKKARTKYLQTSCSNIVITRALHEASLPKLQVLGSMWNGARCYIADRMAALTSTAFPLLGFVKHMTTAASGVKRSHTFNHLAVITDAKHTAALWRSISKIFQSLFVEPVCARKTNSFAIYMVNMALKVAQGHCVCVSVSLCVYIWKQLCCGMLISPDMFSISSTAECSLFTNLHQHSFILAH